MENFVITSADKNKTRTTSWVISSIWVILFFFIIQIQDEYKTDSDGDSDGEGRSSK